MAWALINQEVARSTTDAPDVGPSEGVAMRHRVRRCCVFAGLAGALLLMAACRAPSHASVPALPSSSGQTMATGSATGRPVSTSLSNTDRMRAKAAAERWDVKFTGAVSTEIVVLRQLPPDQLGLVQSACRSAGYGIGPYVDAKLTMATFPVDVPMDTLGGVRFVHVLLQSGKVVGVFGTQPDMAPMVLGFGRPE